MGIKKISYWFVVLVVGNCFSFDLFSQPTVILRPEACLTRPNYRIIGVGIPVPEIPIGCEAYLVSLSYIKDETDYYLSWNLATLLLDGMVIFAKGPKWLLNMVSLPQLIGNWQISQPVIVDCVNIYLGQATDYFIKYVNTETRAGLLVKIGRIDLQGEIKRAWSGPFRDEKIMYGAAIAYAIPRKM